MTDSRRWYIDTQSAHLDKPAIREQRGGTTDPDVDRLVASCPDHDVALLIVRDHNRNLENAA